MTASLRLLSFMAMALPLVTCSSPEGGRLPSSVAVEYDFSPDRLPLAVGQTGKPQPAERVMAVVEPNPLFGDFPGEAPEYRFSLKKSLALECAPGEYEVFEYLAVTDPSLLPATLRAGQTVDLEIPRSALSCPSGTAQGAEDAQASRLRLLPAGAD